MYQYLIRRLLLFIPTMLLATILVFRPVFHRAGGTPPCICSPARTPAAG